VLTIKEEMTDIITSQPDDASYDEIMQELLFKRMVDRGLEDSKKNRTITNEEMQSRIQRWQQ
jgi:ribosomal protein S3AE